MALCDERYASQLKGPECPEEEEEEEEEENT